MTANLLELIAYGEINLWSKPHDTRVLLYTNILHGSNRNVHKSAYETFIATF
jgi:hypothetical protein